MSPAQQRRSASDALGGRRQPAPPRDPAAVPASLRVKPIKATFDVPPALYRKIRVWAGERDLPITEVTKRLFAELLTDDKLARRIETGGQDTM